MAKTKPISRALREFRDGFLALSRKDRDFVLGVYQRSAKNAPSAESRATFARTLGVLEAADQ